MFANNVSAHTYDTILVQPGIYNLTIEGSFPLYMDIPNGTLTSTAGSSATILNGIGVTTGILVNASNITITGFTSGKYITCFALQEVFKDSLLNEEDSYVLFFCIEIVKLRNCSSY